jgi:hypothetical protein
MSYVNTQCEPFISAVRSIAQVYSVFPGLSSRRSRSSVSREAYEERIGTLSSVETVLRQPISLIVERGPGAAGAASKKS